jgi:hypothetical protein
VSGSPKCPTNAKDKLVRGIYELNGDDLKIRFSRNDRERPRDFERRDDISILVLKREKTK